MKNLRILLFLMIPVIIFACKKAGPGGRTKIYVHVMRINQGDTALVPGAKVGVKYDATASPGNSLSGYDKVQTTDYSGKTVFDGLKRGNYFILAVVQDSTRTLTGDTAYSMLNSIGERAVVIEVK